MRRLVIAALVAACGPAQNLPMDPNLLLLARIKHHVSENLKRLPNYTCQQTIERSARRNPRRKFELLDTIRLEVALVDGAELFSWPGAGRFEDRKISDIVGGGTIGNGNFALHARSVFLSSAPTYSYGGESLLDGRRVHSFSYLVRQMQSGFHVKVGSREGVVGYRGSFQVDAATLDLLRLEVRVEEIPPDLAIASSVDIMRYQKVRIGEREFVLPESSELTMTDLQGSESRNRTNFHSCHEYGGESVISFADPPESPNAAAAAPVDKAEFEPGMILDLRLEQPVSFTDTPVGEPLTAVLAGDVKRKGRVLVRKGTRFHGHLVRRGRVPARVETTGFVLEFTEAEESGGRMALRLELVDVGPAVAQNGRISMGAGGAVYVSGSRLQLPTGLRMLWRVQ